MPRPVVYKKTFTKFEWVVVTILLILCGVSCGAIMHLSVGEAIVPDGYVGEYGEYERAKSLDRK